MSVIKDKDTFRATPQQLATLLLFESAAQHLVVSATQLGGFLGLKAEATILQRHAEQLAKELAEMRQAWAQALVIAQPQDVPRMIQP